MNVVSQDAIETLTRELAADPDNAGLLHARGRAWHRLDDNDRAIADYDRDNIPDIIVANRLVDSTISLIFGTAANARTLATDLKPGPSPHALDDQQARR